MMEGRIGMNKKDRSIYVNKVSITKGSIDSWNGLQVEVVQTMNIDSLKTPLDKSILKMLLICLGQQ